MTLTGTRILELLEQPWSGAGDERRLQVAGLRYRFHLERSSRRRVVSASIGGRALDPAAAYTLTTNSFLALGGDGFTTLCLGRERTAGPAVADALITFLLRLTQPFAWAIDGRVERLTEREP